MISYAVVDRAIRNDDGVLHWYTGLTGSSSNHNYYWYEEPIKKKIHLIPWDLDSAFENLTATNPITFIPDRWGEISNDCKPFLMEIGKFGSALLGAIKLSKHGALLMESIKDCKKTR